MGYMGEGAGCRWGGGIGGLCGEGCMWGGM